jgi:hypothetical protein
VGDLSDEFEVAAGNRERCSQSRRHQDRQLELKEHTLDTTTAEARTVNHPVVTRDQRVAECKALLAREGELTRLRDQIARERRQGMPGWRSGPS